MTEYIGRWSGSFRQTPGEMKSLQIGEARRINTLSEEVECEELARVMIS